MKLRPFLVGALIVVGGIWLKGPPPILRDDPPTPPLEGRPVRIEVLNGSGVHRAGQGLADSLRRRGFDVVAIANAKESADSTQVIDRVGNPEYARSVALRMGFQEPIEDVAPDLLVDVTVVLGRDRGQEYGREW